MTILLRGFYKEKDFKGVKGFNFGVGILGPPLMTAWCYAVDDLLVDTGITRMRKKALATLSSQRPSRILLTHHHEDHSGNAGPLAKQLNAKVYGHSYAAKKLATPYRIFPYQHLMWGRAAPVKVHPFDKVIETRTMALHPIHTPGHSKDHTVFFEKTKGWLFSGDLFLGEKIKYFRADENMPQQIFSLKKALSLEFDTLFCAHRPTMSKGKQALSRKLDFLENLTEEVLFHHKKGLDEKEIIQALDTKADRTIRWITMDNVSFGHMVRSILNDHC